MAYLINQSVLEKIVQAHLYSLNIHLLDIKTEQEKDRCIIRLALQPQRTLSQNTTSELQTQLYKEIRGCFSDSNYSLELNLQPSPSPLSSWWTTLTDTIKKFMP